MKLRNSFAMSAYILIVWIIAWANFIVLVSGLSSELCQ